MRPIRTCRARTPTGWKSNVVRIMDNFPDTQCDIDLGGAPARELMWEKPGRYAAEAENLFQVPPPVLQASHPKSLIVWCRLLPSQVPPDRPLQCS